MTTYGDRFQAEVANDLVAAQSLPERHYSVEEIKAMVSAAGTRLELFLKGVVFPESKSRETFEHLIDRLPGYGVSGSATQALHHLRQAYNRAKHEPTYEPALLSVLDLLRRYDEAAHEVVALGLGITDRPVRETNRRVFWVAACDHYIGGDTEVHVYLPARPEGWPVPPSLDLVYVDMGSWDDIKEALDVMGELGPAEVHFPESMLEILTEEEGFLEAFVFEGDYRSLLTTLTQHEKRHDDLIPGLRRQDSLTAMLQAFSLAALDVASVADHLDQESLSSEIKAQAIQVYAVPEHLAAANDLASGMARMVCQVEVADRPHLAGPIWVDMREFKVREANALALHPDYRILLDQNRTLCIVR